MNLSKEMEKKKPKDVRKNYAYKLNKVDSLQFTLSVNILVCFCSLEKLAMDKFYNISSMLRGKDMYYKLLLLVLATSAFFYSFYLIYL